MAKYTFKTLCPADTYTEIATGVSEVTFYTDINGRLIVQDVADAAPVEAATGYMEIAAGRRYNLAVFGLEVFFRPWGVASNVNGMKK